MIPAPLRLPILIVLFAGLMALGALIDVPMHPVPMTMQSFAVLLAGAVLGPRWGVVAVLLYLALALIGLPVLSDGAGGPAPFTGATAGYLFAFPVVAGLAGLAARRGWLTHPLPGVAILFGLHLILLALGGAWLATKIGAPDALAQGVTPFLIGAAVKSALVWIGWRLLRRFQTR